MNVPADYSDDHFVKLVREHNALTKDAIILLKEHITTRIMPAQTTPTVYTEFHLYIGYMYRSLVERDITRQEANLLNSLPYIKKVVQMIEQDTKGELFLWLRMRLLMDSSEALTFLIARDMSENDKVLLLINEIDLDPLIVRFRK